MNAIRWIALSVLCAAAVVIWAAPTPSGFAVSFLDVGQGDSILIESGNVQMLIDGGADQSVLRELGKKMPFWDRRIDAVVATHPDKDHIGGLVDVIKRYKVGTFIESGVESDTPHAAALKKEVTKKNLDPVLARRGMRIELGSGGYADILFPDRDVPTIETNTGSIIMRVAYGGTSFMLTGDAPSSVEKYLVALNRGELDSDILKAGHHGSKTSSAETFISAVSPQAVVFSRGCDNTYGHPAKEVAERFQKLKIPALDTCENGTITFTSDGKTLHSGTFR